MYQIKVCNLENEEDKVTLTSEKDFIIVLSPPEIEKASEIHIHSKNPVSMLSMASTLVAVVCESTGVDIKDFVDCLLSISDDVVIDPINTTKEETLN